MVVYDTQGGEKDPPKVQELELAKLEENERVKGMLSPQAVQMTAGIGGGRREDVSDPGLPRRSLRVTAPTTPS